MQIDEFTELVRKRRTIRRFKPDPISDEYIEKMLEVTRWAQSGGNSQPWEFIVTKDREDINRIAKLWVEHRKRIWDIEKTRIEELRQSSVVGGPGGPPGFKDAPVLIVMCGDPRTLQSSLLLGSFLPGEGGPNALFLKSMANATQILHLAAASLGLASQWVSVNYAWEAKLKAILDIPDELMVHTIVPVGYPAYEPSPSYRRELKEMVHFGKYDHSKFRSGDDIFQYVLALRSREKPAYQAAKS